MSRVFLVSLCLLGCSWLSYAQQGRGVILGDVTDPSGAAVVGAKVGILNVATNAALDLVSNSEGRYTSPPLIPGDYRVTAEATGFRKEVRSGLSLQVGQRAEVNFLLQVGAVGESLQVTAEAPLVNTEDATLGQVVDNQRVQELPVNGRSAFALIELAPNAHSNAGPTQSGFADRGTNLSAFSINGGPTAINNLLVDGMGAVNSYYPDLNADLAVDAVQEFKVQSGSMSAEYGFTAGGVINVATKAGTNTPHGSAYEFVRNNAFDARNAFAIARPPFRYNQYGAALGAPVFLPKIYDGRNRTFVFGNWEAWKYVRDSQSIASVPIAAQRRGDFSGLLDATGRQIPVYDPNTTAANPSGSGFVRSVFPGNIIPTNRLDPVALAYNQFYPLPNRTPLNPFTNAENYIGPVNENRHMDQYTVRLDHRISDKDAVFGRYTHFLHYTDNGTSAPWPDPIVRARYDNFETRNASVSETHTFSPTILNELRIGIARQYFPFQAASYGGNWPQKLGFPAIVPGTVIPTVSTGYTGFVTNTVGLRGALTWDVVDTVTVVRGKHSIKLGSEYRLLFGNNLQTSAPSGNYSFGGGLTGNPQNQTGTGSTYASFLLGAVSSASITLNVGESQKGFTWSGFVQDDWRLSRRLSINLGLRYDYQQPPYERNNGSSNFNPYQRDSNYGILGRLEFAGQDYGRAFLNPDKNDFAPRVGLAYDLSGNGTTVIRVGYAIYYPSSFNINYFGNTQGFASTTTGYNAPGGNTNLPAFRLSQGFPTAPTQPLGRLLGPSALLSQGTSYDQADQRTPMSQQWSFSLQKQLPGKWMVDVSYSANHGTHLVAGGYDLNQLDPKYQVNGLALQNQVPNPYAGKGLPGSLGGSTISLSQSLKPYPYYTGISVRNPHMGNSNYHAALVTVQKRFAQGLTLLGSYTKSKLIDDSVVTPIGFGSVEQVTTTGYQNGLFNRRAERSLDPTDVSQRLVISGIYELPFGKGKRLHSSSAVVNHVIGGWQFQTIQTYQLGLPVVVSGANNNLANRPNSVGRSAKVDNPTASRWFDTTAFVNPPGFTYGNVGRVLPDVRSPGVVNLDISVSKTTAIHEKAKLQFRAEAFNAFNHVNLGFPGGGFSPGPNGTNVSSTFGVITSAREPRNVQLGLKLIF
jgi:hypothetical protein